MFRSCPKVYLAGPITGLNYRGANDWRAQVAHDLAPEIVAYNPMRGKEYLSKLQVIEDAAVQLAAVDPNGLGKVMSSAQGITGRDRNDVKTADAVLMNLLGAERVSIGTMIEAGWADAFRVPLVVAREQGDLHQHGMLDSIAVYTVGTLEEAVHLVRVLVLP